MSVTGINELDVGYLSSKLGSMAGSTKCCGTGTCKAYSSHAIDDNLINTSLDIIDAFKIRNKYGSPLEL